VAKPAAAGPGCHLGPRAATRTLDGVLRPTAEILSPAAWQSRQAAHQARADALTAGHRARKQRHEAHPIEDFLHTYYPFSTGRMRQWHPGWRTALAGSESELDAFAAPTHYRRDPAPDGGLLLRADVDSFLAKRKDSVRWTADLLRRTLGRPARFGCFGLHEWAMVYRADPEQVRHRGLPLRLGAAGTDAVVEAEQLTCTHFDAFRFFTPAAGPRNRGPLREPGTGRSLPLSRATQPATEQSGCLHAGMDLYKWALKMSPLVPSELALDCFELARDIRYLDMDASPYDVRVLGREPVPIETPEGKATYVRAQRGFAERGDVLRRRMLAELEPLGSSAHMTA
jgi:hypothetical protein